MRVLQFQAAEDPGKRELRRQSYVVARHNITVAMPGYRASRCSSNSPSSGPFASYGTKGRPDSVVCFVYGVFLNMLTIAIVLVTVSEFVRATGRILC